MLWEATKAKEQTNDGKPYYENVKNILGEVAGYTSRMLHSSAIIIAVLGI